MILRIPLRLPMMDCVSRLASWPEFESKLFYVLRVPTDMKKLLLLLLGLVLTFIPASVAYAKLKPGHLDPSFGHDGKVIAPMSFGEDQGSGEKATIAKLPRGRVVVLIHNKLLAFRQGGRPAREFGGGRVSIVSSPVPSSTFSDLAIDSAGRVVVGGTTWFSAGPPWTWSGDEDIVLARFTGNGSLDPTFGAGGAVRADFGGPFQGTGELSWISGPPISRLGGLAVDSNGRILLSGLGANRVVSCKPGLYLASGDAYLGRLLEDGEFDPSFGQSGRALLQGSAWVRSPVLTDSGVLYLLDGPGTACGSSISRVSGWRGDGTSEVTFGQSGAVSIGGRSGGHAITVDHNDRIVVVEAGQNKRTRSWFVQLRRILPDGERDQSFGVDGVARMAAPAGSRFFPNAIAVESSGKIVVAGDSSRTGSASSPHRFIVARFTATGAVDRSFGHRGHVVTGFGRNSEAQATSLALVPGGILVAGPISSPDLLRGGGLALARYLSR